MINRSENIQEYMMDAVRVLIGCFVLFSFTSLLESKTNDKESSHAKTLVEQANKWYEISNQDKQSIYTLQHSNYAVAYLQAARHFASDTSLERSSGHDIHLLYRKIDEKQKQAQKDLMNKSSNKEKKTMHAPSAWI